MLTAFLFFIFGQTRTGATNGYSAVFNDASRLEAGRHRAGRGHPGRHRRGCVAAGRQQGPGQVRRRPQHRADHRHQGRDPLSQPGRAIATWNSSTAPGSTKILPVGSQIPVDRTAPALDLDLLLGGLKPVIQGLNPQDVNALTASLIQILQGQGGTLDSLFSKTSSFTNSLADNNQVIEQLIDDLRTRWTRCPRTATSSPARSTGSSSWSTGCPRTAIPIGTAIDVARQRHRLAGRPARSGAAAVGRHGRPAEQARPDARQRQGPPRRHPPAAARASTASSRGSAPTAPSSPTTSAGSRSAPATFRAAPCSLPVDQARNGKVRGRARC